VLRADRLRKFALHARSLSSSTSSSGQSASVDGQNHVSTRAARPHKGRRKSLPSELLVNEPLEALPSRALKPLHDQTRALASVGGKSLLIKRHTHSADPSRRRSSTASSVSCGPFSDDENLLGDSGTSYTCLFQFPCACADTETRRPRSCNAADGQCVDGLTCTYACKGITQEQHRGDIERGTPANVCCTPDNVLEGTGSFTGRGVSPRSGHARTLSDDSLHILGQMV
jgi:hypothetical protein